MGTTVITKSICDMCKEKVERESTDGKEPEGWWEVRLSRRERVVEKHPWLAANNKYRTLCPSCGEKTLEFLGGQK